MNTRMKIATKAFAFMSLSGAFLIGTAEARIVSHSKDIVVEQPADLPELAQRTGIALQLYSGGGDGTTYLYIEQHRGERLLVLDITDPEHTKMVGSVSLSVPAPFDFVGPLGDSAMLVRFRNNQGVAVLDLKKAKAPTLKTVDGLQLSGRTEPLGETAFLMVNEKRVGEQQLPRDYQVVDTSIPSAPVLLDTVKLVTTKATREVTGTTFLLGSEGLTVIRRPRVEQQYQIHVDSMKN